MVLHYALVWGKVRDLGSSPADVQMVGVTLAFYLRIGAENDIGLKFSDDLRNGAFKIIELVKSAVAKREKANVRNAECRRRCLCLA